MKDSDTNHVLFANNVVFLAVEDDKEEGQQCGLLAIWSKDSDFKYQSFTQLVLNTGRALRHHLHLY